AGYRPVLATGSTGLDVQRLQRALTAALGRTVPVDGSFGSVTDQAVRDYQSSRGLAVDGTVRTATWSALPAGPGGAAPGPPARPAPERAGRRSEVRQVRVCYECPPSGPPPGARVDPHGSGYSRGGANLPRCRNEDAVRSHRARWRGPGAGAD